ncbi:MAG: DNA alkylation repair protein [bacterium]|nr:DNA alkylation repair protein [bacterium]
MNLTQIHKEMKAAGNAERAAHAQGFFKTGKGQYGEGDRFLGIRVPVTRTIARKCRELSLKQTTRLLHSVYHEERLLALFVLVWQFQRSDDSGQTEIYNLYLDNTSFINNWDLVDSSAHLIVGPWLENRPRKILTELAVSGTLWERRIAMMATYHFIRQNEYSDTLKIAKILLQDDHDLIHKSVGWMLREIGNRDLETEEVFLKKHILKMPRTMVRYAIEKFPEELRLHYLKMK